MAENRKANTAIAISTASAVASAIVLLRSNKVAASPGPGTFPNEVIELLIAIAKSLDTIAARGFGQGWPPNTESARTMAVVCDQANLPYQAPDIIVPDGMAITIKASPINAVGAFIYLAKTRGEVFNPMTAWPLIRNESIPYFVKNAKIFWVGSNVPGSVALFTVEQRS